MRRFFLCVAVISLILFSWGCSQRRHLSKANIGYKFRFDLRNTGFNPNASPIYQPNLLWKFKAKNEVMSSPVLDGMGNVYVGSHDGYLYIIGDSGRLKGKYKTLDVVVSSPLILGSMVYWGSFDGCFYSLDTRSGRRKSFVDGDWICSSASYWGSSIIFASNSGKLYCLDSNLNQILWKQDIGKQRYEIHSSPALWRGKVYVGSEDGNLYAFNVKKGTLLWKYETKGAIYSSPAVDLDGNIFFGSWDGSMYCLDDKGKLLWRFRCGEVTSSPALWQGNVLFGDKKGYLYSLRAKNGKLNWKFYLGFPTESSPSVDREGTVYIGCDGGIFFAIDKNGKKMWEFKTKGPILSSPVLSKDGKVIFGCEDWHIYCLTSSLDKPK